MRIHGAWRGFACSYCGLWYGRTGETSVLSQVSLDAFLVCYKPLLLLPSADSMVPSLLLSHAQGADPSGGVL